MPHRPTVDGCICSCERAATGEQLPELLRLDACRGRQRSDKECRLGYSEFRRRYVSCEFLPDGKWISYIALPVDGSPIVSLSMSGWSLSSGCRPTHKDFTISITHRGGERIPRLCILLWTTARSGECQWNSCCSQGCSPDGLHNRCGCPSVTNLSNAYWSPDQDGQWSFRLLTIWGRARFSELILRPAVDTVDCGDQSFGGTSNLLVGSPDGASIIYGSEDPGHSLNCGPRRRVHHPKQLSQLNPQLGRYVTAMSKSCNGSARRRPGARSVVLPSAYKQGEKYPLVVLSIQGTKI